MTAEDIRTIINIIAGLIITHNQSDSKGNVVSSLYSGNTFEFKGHRSRHISCVIELIPMIGPVWASIWNKTAPESLSKHQTVLASVDAYTRRGNKE